MEWFSRYDTNFQAADPRAGPREKPCNNSALQENIIFQFATFEVSKMESSLYTSHEILLGKNDGILIQWLTPP